MFKLVKIVLLSGAVAAATTACKDDDKSIPTEGENEGVEGEGESGGGDGGQGEGEAVPDGGDAGEGEGDTGDPGDGGEGGEGEGEGEGGPDPCDPNPCDQATGLSVCEASGDGQGGHTCVCDPEFYEIDGEGQCVAVEQAPIEPEVPQPPENEEGTYVPGVEIVAPDGTPIQGAKLFTGGLVWASREDGVIRMAGQSLAEAIGVRITAAGYADMHTQLTWLNAGDTPLRVQMTPVEIEATLPSAVGGALRTPAATLSVPGNGIVAANGRRYDGPVQVSVATLVRGRDNMADAAPAPVGLDEAGQEVPLKPLVQVTVDLRDPEGRPLQIAPDRRVPVRVRLPDDAGVEAGTALGVSTYDPRLQLWVQENTCTVEADDDGGLSCEAAAAHFSSILWTGPPHRNFCGVGRLRYVGVPSRFEIEGRSFYFNRDCGLRGRAAYRSCRMPENMEIGCYYDDDGSPNCRRGGEVTYTPGCAATAYDPAYPFFEVVVDVTLTDKRTGLSTRATDVRTMPLPAEALQHEFASSFSTRWRQSWRSRLCRPIDYGCRNYVLDINLSDVVANIMAGYVDNDGDGYPVFRGDPPEGAEDVRVDCDDNDRNARPAPGREEVPCNDVDENCDGDLGPRAYRPEDFANDPAGWNELCALRQGEHPHPRTECMELGLEETDNDLDEDCEGGADDRDGDGVSAPLDCDDGDEDVHPGATEVPHNDVDEDCDGRAVDHDNDGYGMPDHFPFGDLDQDRYTDCNDFDDTVFPGADRGDRETTFARFYGAAPDEDGGEGEGEGDGVDLGEWGRQLAFCSNFEPWGGLRAVRRHLLLDANCDGFSSDIDGDGWFVYGDATAAIGRLGDCDDLDPRVHPEEDGQGGTTECAAAVERLNDGDCEVDLARFGGGCPPTGRRVRRPAWMPGWPARTCRPASRPSA